jgi:pimeloyl-ACP methyl ester carboxylesterase
VSTRCAPSYGLRAGLQTGLTNSSGETVAMAVALARGWAVVAPDYEGPRSEWLGAKGAARGVLDGVRATLAFGPAGLDRGTSPVGLLGYSGGALASTLAAQLQPRYAPHLSLAGVALGGVPGSIRASMNAFSGSPVGGTIAIGLIGLDRSYPGVDIPGFLNDLGRRALAEAGGDCINDAALRFPLARIEDFLADPAALYLPETARLFRRTSPATFRGTPDAPVYMYHSVFDELAPIGPARELAKRFCAAGVAVKKYEDVLSEHVTLTATGYPAALSYLGDRFAGRPAPSNC